MKVDNVNIDIIKPYFDNPRDNKKAIRPVANSIQEFGFQQPIVVDKNNVIIVGHTRYEASKKLHLKQVPVVVATNLSDEQVKAYRLADNKTHDKSEWNDELLENELLGIDDDINMADFGFDDEDVEDEKQADETDISNNLEENFQVIVNCKDEEDLESTYNKLDAEGYDVDVSTM